MNVRRFNALLLLCFAFLTPVAFAASPNVVISQVFPGGASGGAAYTNDYVELFNTTNAAVTLTGWSIQYGSSTGQFGSSAGNIFAFPAGTTIAANKYLLIKLGGTTAGAATFTGDLTSSIAMSGTAGKVALANQAATLNCGATATPCALPNAAIIDLVSWGASNDAEGGVTVNAGTNIDPTRGMIRKSDGCTDTDNNNADFIVATIAGGLVPRTAASPANICGVVVNNPPAIASVANPITTTTVNAAPFAVSLSGSDDNNIYQWSATAGTGIAAVVVSGGQGTANATFTVTLQSGFTGTATFTGSLSDGVNAPATRAVNILVNAAVNNPPSINAPANPITTVEQNAAPFNVTLTGSDDNAVYNWSALPGTGVSFVTVSAGQGTATATFSVGLQSGFNGTATFTASLSDNVNAAASRTVNVTVTAPPPPADHVVISQVYGGGGNTAATYTNDFVELYNPTASTTFNLAGWTIQYQAATSTGTWANIQPLGGLIAPGEYFLIALGTNGNIGSALPLPNIDGTLNLSGTTGKVALASNGDPLNGCPLSDPDLVDLVGYGTANCHEGSGNAPAPSNQNSVFRKLGGAQDTNVNSADFTAALANPRRTAPIMETGPSITSTDPISNGSNVPRDGSIIVNFNEAVTADANFFDITCATTGSHNDATVASIFDGTGLVIIPNVNFLAAEQCTVTVFATAVHDQDLDDATAGTDTLFANRVWTFTVATGTAPAYAPEVHLTMGNPSDAAADLLTPNNYLMSKPELALSYNRDRGTPNWVSWHLADEWVGSLTRVDTFRPDPQVPPDWYRVLGSDYSGSGFDRGHMTPNADRDKETSIPINQATFLMTNMVPQAPDNNQGPWANMENDLRALLPANELYIVAGGAGTGGTGSNGFATSVANGHVAVPASTWKVVLVLPKSSGDDVANVTAGTRTIAVLMPNVQGIRNNNWMSYLTTVDAIEALTGYDFFENVPDAIENAIEAGVNGSNPPGAAGASVSTSEDTPRSISLDAAGTGSLTYHVVGGPSHGTVTLSGGTATYTPAPDYFGSDSFQFNVTSGSSTSNTATVTITVSEVNDAPTAASDVLNATEDTPLTFSAATLLVNDVAGPANEGSQALTVTSVEGASLAGGTITFTPAANFNGPATISYQVCDNGVTAGLTTPLCATANVLINVAAVNDLPSVSLSAPSTVSEGTPVAATASVSDVDDTVFSYAWTVTKNGSPFATSPSFTPDDDGAYVVTVVVTDAQGGTATASATVSVSNVAPSITAVSGPGAALSLGTPTTIAINVTDPGAADTHTAFFTWDDGSSSSAACAAGVCSGSHTYAANGVYDVAITVADDDGGATAATFAGIVVFDVNSPSVTGGGTFQFNGGGVTFSLNPSYAKNGLTGKAQFEGSGVSLESTSLEWLVVTGNTARLKGAAGTNTFLVTVTDGNPDTLRLQIWNAANAVVFDNVTPAPVSGNVTIHKK